jgi:hypothetical protein
MMMTGLCLIGVLAAQPPATQPASEASSPSTPQPPASQPSLDDLLEIEPEEESDADQPAEEARQRQLDEALSEEEAADAFEAAVKQMNLAAGQLRKRDAGIGTQRVQEEVLRKLDAVIESAKKNQRQQSASSSSSSGQQGQQKEQQQQPPSNPQQPRDQSQGRAHGNENRDVIDPPPPQEGPLNSILDESRTEWGALPERVRDLIQQGMSDRVSAMYRRMTEEYYRRLAEESSK